jgi:AraC family transcriptional regulator
MAIEQSNTTYREKTISFYYQATERVISVMHKRLGEAFSLQDMAEIAGISPYHFNRVFRQVTRIPPSQFLNALRLEAAKKLLLTTKLNVTDICYEVGYNSLGTFITRFTKLVGVSPTKLRNLQEGGSPYLNFFVNDNNSPENNDFLNVTGKIEALKGDIGLIIVGLFDTPIPQGLPIACTLLTAPSNYHIYHLADGIYYPFAAAFSWTQNPITTWLKNELLQGFSNPIIIHHGQICEKLQKELDMTIYMREAQITNPPLLFPLPLFLAKYWPDQSSPFTLAPFSVEGYN